MQPDMPQERKTIDLNGDWQITCESLGEQDGVHQIKVNVSCRHYARMVHFTGPRMSGGTADGPPVYFSDNYFDLRPGEEKSVILKSQAPVDAEVVGMAHWLDTWTQ